MSISKQTPGTETQRTLRDCEPSTYRLESRSAFRRRWTIGTQHNSRQGERAYVEEQLGNLFAILDREVKVIDLPKLSPEVARIQVARLISGPRARTLRTLAEIRLYQAQGLITESEVEAAYDIIGGVDALMLLHGPLDERLAMARQWAVDSQPQINK